MSFSASKLILFSFLMCSLAKAAPFHNAYISFELPDTWSCQLSEENKAVWICKSKNTTEIKEAIIVFTAKEVAPYDSIPLYEEYLKKEKFVSGADGKAVKTEVKQISRRKINDLDWLDGLLLAGQLPNFYTRYLATVKGKLAVLVTFTAHQKYYTKYSADFVKSIQSLRITATDEIFNTANVGNIQHSGNELFGANLSANIPDNMYTEECLDEECGAPKSKNDMLNKIFAFLILLLAIIGYVVIKKSQRQRKK